MKTVAHYNSIVPNTCGVGVLGVFREDQQNTDAIKIGKLVPITGCGWVIAGFTTERLAYKEAYKELCARWPVVYQSPVRRNRRTNRQFFFCIFDTKGKVV